MLLSRHDATERCPPTLTPSDESGSFVSTTEQVSSIENESERSAEASSDSAMESSSEHSSDSGEITLPEIDL